VDHDMEKDLKNAQGWRQLLRTPGKHVLERSPETAPEVAERSGVKTQRHMTCMNASVPPNVKGYTYALADLCFRWLL
jgi:hypothetical protein